MRVIWGVVAASALALVVAMGVWASAGATLKVEKTKLGNVVVSSNGHTLYMFRADRGPKSACYGSCASFWPPLITSGKPVAGAGIKSALLGTAKRKNGKLQVTYKGHLLYLFAEDQKPGQTTGEGLNNFGAKWYALTPKGAVIDRD